MLNDIFFSKTQHNRKCTLLKFFLIHSLCFCFIHESLSGEVEALALKKIANIEVDESNISANILQQRDSLISTINNLTPSPKRQAILFGQDSKEAATNQTGDGSVDYFNAANVEAGITLLDITGFGDTHIASTLESAKGKLVSIGIQFVPGICKVLSDIANDLQLLRDQEIQDGVAESDLTSTLKFLINVSNNGVGMQKSSATSLINFAELLIEEGNLGTDIEVRPGYEVDGTWNGHTPEHLKASFRLVSDLLIDEKEGLNLKNIELVYQIAAWPVRQGDKIYDIYNGEVPSSAAVKRHLELWDPELASDGTKLSTKNYYQQVGLSIFRSDSASELWQRSLAIDNPQDPEGVIDNIRTTIWDTVATYALDNSKTLQISELYPTGVFGNTAHWNTLVTSHQENTANTANVFTLEGTTKDAVPVLLPFQTSHVAIDDFYDLDAAGSDQTPKTKILKADEVFNTFIVDVGAFLAANSSNISSVNLITYNWETHFGWEIIEEFPGAKLGQANSGAWGNGWQQKWIDAIVSATKGTAPSKVPNVTPFTAEELQVPTP